MTTTTDLLRRAADVVMDLVVRLRKQDKYDEATEAYRDYEGLLALADEWERAEPVAWLVTEGQACIDNLAAAVKEAEEAVQALLRKLSQPAMQEAA